MAKQVRDALGTVLMRLDDASEKAPMAMGSQDAGDFQAFVEASQIASCGDCSVPPPTSTRRSAADERSSVGCRWDHDMLLSAVGNDTTCLIRPAAGPERTVVVA